MTANEGFIQFALVVAATVLALGGFNIAAGVAVALFIGLWML